MPPAGTQNEGTRAHSFHSFKAPRRKGLNHVFLNEKISLTEAGRHREKKEDSNGDSLSAASEVSARDMLLGCGRRPH